MAEIKCKVCGLPLEGDYEYRSQAGGYAARHIDSCPTSQNTENDDHPNICERCGREPACVEHFGPCPVLPNSGASS